MNRRRILFASIILTVLLCGGCSLADPGMQQSSDKDYMCGAFVLLESQMEDFEKNLYDEQGNFKKTYANEAGEGEEKTYKFGNVPGYYWFLMKQGDTMRDEGNLAGKGRAHMISVEENSNSNKDTLEMKLCFSRGLDDGFAVYPVRKDDKGYYIAGRNSAVLSSDVGATISDEEDWVSQADGETINKSFEYKVSLEPADPIKSVAVNQMDQNDQVIKSTPIKFKEDKYTCKLEPQTEYVIVEETYVNESGKERTKHTAYDWQTINSNEEEMEDTSHFCYLTDKPGFIMPKEIVFEK